MRRMAQFYPQKFPDIQRNPCGGRESVDIHGRIKYRIVRLSLPDAFTAKVNSGMRSPNCSLCITLAAKD